MRSLTSIVAGLSLFAATQAAVFPGRISGRPGNLACLQESEAEYLTDEFASLITAYNATVADYLLTENFTDTSDSINWLAKNPLGTVTFPSLAAFEAGQGSQPPIPFEILNITHSCDSVLFRWKSAQKPDEVLGINIFKVINIDPIARYFQIYENFIEFNSAAWLINLGANLTAPSKPGSK